VDVSVSDGSDSDDDDDDKRTCGDAVAVVGSSLFDFVARRFDLLVGVAGLMSALWLWLLLDEAQRMDGDDHAWRWALFVACVFLGRWVARSLVSLVIFALDRYDVVRRSARTDAKFVGVAARERRGVADKRRLHGERHREETFPVTETFTTRDAR